MLQSRCVGKISEIIGKILNCCKGSYKTTDLSIRKELTQGKIMLSVTNAYFYEMDEEDRLVYARVRNSETGEESIMSREVLEDPDSIDVGDEIDYSLQITKDNLFTHEDLTELNWKTTYFSGR